MGYTFSEIIDVEAVQELMTSLWEASGIPVGIIDPDGNILIATGWQRICTDYHRRHPETEALCRESDRYIEEHLHAGDLPECGYVEYRCKNGMIDIGVPIVIEDRHLATLFLGQFFYEPPDEEHFREQAGRHGFDEDQYLEHLREVPIFSREKVKAILNYHTRFVNMLTGMGVQKLRQVRVQQELEKSEEKYRTLYNKTPVMLHTIDSRGRLLSVSDYWLETLGYERSEVLGRKAMEFLTEESRRYAEEVALPQFLKTGSVKNVAYQFVKKNDEVMDVLLSAVAERNEKGEIVRGLAVTTDITESKRAEETLRDSERRFRTLVEAIPHGIQECDTEGIITLTNRGYDRMFGYEPGEAVGEAIWEKEVGEGKDALRKYLADLVREEPEPVPYFTRNSTRDGRLIDLQVDWNYKRDEAGTLLGFTSIITDITERKAAKDALRESERRLSTLMGNLPGMAYRCRNDRDWAMEFVSEGCRALVGYASEDLVGNRTLAYNDLIHPDDRVDVWERSRPPWRRNSRSRSSTGSEPQGGRPAGSGNRDRGCSRRPASSSRWRGSYPTSPTARRPRSRSKAWPGSPRKTPTRSCGSAPKAPSCSPTRGGWHCCPSWGRGWASRSTKTGANGSARRWPWTGRGNARNSSGSAGTASPWCR
ncbi:MAG: hypothetical protein C0617_08790 [Desulfuromonas sp.]|nr:PocR ligand-binding domain-containing protein [Desulfuromonas sp.]PLX84166.1 MAG: hypothetical protein C0617_08790 [Desulfuromonas sp.]